MTIAQLACKESQAFKEYKRNPSDASYKAWKVYETELHEVRHSVRNRGLLEGE